MKVCLVAPAPNESGATAHSPRALAATAAVRRLYADGGPDLLEVPDFRAPGLVPLQARLGGDPLLARTTIATRVSPTTELINLQDGNLHLYANRRLAELEREQLRLSDRLLWPGGDCLGLHAGFRGLLRHLRARLIIRAGGGAARGPRGR